MAATQRTAAQLLRRATQTSSSSSTAFSTQIRAKTTSSTSALAYKALHRRSPPALPVAETSASGSYGAAAAVSSILYETPAVSRAPPKKHILNCLVQNEPGVLSRISGILAARGFNIDSLVVCNTEVEDLSRMTIVLQGLDGVVEQARRQLLDIVPVWAVLDYTNAALVQRELLLAKVSILGPEVYEEIMEHHREITQPESSFEGEPASESDIERSAEERLQELESGGSSEQDQTILEKARQMLGSASNYHPNRLAVSQALRHKHEHLEAITHLTHQFGGKILDISSNNCIVELSAKTSRIDSFMKLIAPFGILESQRTGLIALPRSALKGPNEELEKDAGDLVDASTLPPG